MTVSMSLEYGRCPFKLATIIGKMPGSAFEGHKRQPIRVTKRYSFRWPEHGTDWQIRSQRSAASLSLPQSQLW